MEFARKMELVKTNNIKYQLKPKPKVVSSSKKSFPRTEEIAKKVEISKSLYFGNNTVKQERNV